ncbi:MAG: dipeptide epimerase [Candidatus Obscuribacterales bacterium]|nr:dipeptide epimerase [Candidatus Obscuribacterales bacterium]
MELSFESLILETKHPFGIASGTTASRENVWVRLYHNGLEGWGEAAPIRYHNESAATVASALEKFRQADLLGSDPFAIQRISERMEQFLPNNYSAKNAIEVALHDLCGKLSNLSTSSMLGLNELPLPLTSFTIGIDVLDKIEAKTREALESGFKILKIKLGTDHDQEIIKRVRGVAANIPLRIDANGAWTVDIAVKMSGFLAEHNIEFLEQPLPKDAPIQDWQYLKEHTQIPIFADESCQRSTDAARLAGTVNGIVIKLAKTGGLQEAIRTASIARAHGLKIMIGCMIESSLGITAAAILSSLADYADLDGALLLAEDPFSGARYENGRICPNNKAGLGVEKRGSIS